LPSSSRSAAVFIALGGSSYAVATGAIGSRELKNNAVRGVDLRNNDVRSVDVRNGTLTGAGVKADALTGADVRESTLRTVPSASTATTAAAAQRASRADTVDTATRTDSADRASRADSFDDAWPAAGGAPGEGRDRRSATRRDTGRLALGVPGRASDAARGSGCLDARADPIVDEAIRRMRRSPRHAARCRANAELAARRAGRRRARPQLRSPTSTSRRRCSPASPVEGDTGHPLKVALGDLALREEHVVLIRLLPPGQSERLDAVRRHDRGSSAAGVCRSPPETLASTRLRWCGFALLDTIHSPSVDGSSG
jgi:hypothetical protein